MKKYAKKISILALALVALLCLTVFSANKQVIKVGYVLNYGVIKEPSSEGFNGYGYEYLEKIAEYSGGKYKFEYIPCELSEYETLLNNGDIDLFAPAQYESSKVGQLIYSQNEFATNSILIADLKQVDDICNQYEDLNGKTIGVLNNANLVAGLETFLSKYNIQAEVVKTQIGDFATEYKKKTYDFIIAGSLQMEQNLKPIAKISETPVFLVTSANNATLMNDIDNAMAEIDRMEYNFVKKLTLKYFDYNLTYKEHISVDEYNQLLTKAPLKIGVSNTQTPFGYKNINGDVAGVSVDAIELLFKDFDVAIEYEFLPSEPTESDYNNYDMLLLSTAQVNSMSKNKSKPFANVPFVMVEEVGAEYQTIGALESYGTGNDVIDYFQPLQNVVRFKTPDEIVKAFNKGDINALFLSEATFNMILTEIEPVNHKLSEIAYYYSPVVTFSEKFTEDDIEIFNKMISYISTEDIEYSVLKHSTLINTKSLWDYLKSLDVLYIVIIIGLCIAFAIIHKLTDKKRHKQMINRSKVDDLTELETEQQFIKDVRRILDENSNGTYSIISVDIDNFKFINESSGYNVGTKIIKMLADFLNNVAEDGMPCARCFADNFVIMVDTYGLAQKIEKFITEENFLEQINTFLSREHPVSFSLGRYTIENKDEDVSHMIDCANSARAIGKKSIGTTMHKYTEEIKRKADVQNDIIASMNKAIADKEFILYYQLKVDLKELQLAGAEALVRWVSDDKIIPPNDFIPVFEENGFIEKLDYYVIDAACQFIQANRGRKFPKISVNVSGITLLKKNMVSNLLAITKKYGVDPSEIDLEITESAFVDHTEFSQSKIRKLRGLGFTISMDDFGTGISTLNRLKDIHFDTLKIDRAFIIDSLDNKRSTKIIKNIIQMARDLDLDTVAEGIETPEQLIFLRDMGCEYGQGYYFSKPLPEDDFLEILKKY